MRMCYRFVANFTHIFFSSLDSYRQPLIHQHGTPPMCAKRFAAKRPLYCRATRCPIPSRVVKVIAERRLTHPPTCFAITNNSSREWCGSCTISHHGFSRHSGVPRTTIISRTSSPSFSGTLVTKKSTGIEEDTRRTFSHPAQIQPLLQSFLWLFRLPPASSFGKTSSERNCQKPKWRAVESHPGFEEHRRRRE